MKEQILRQVYQHAELSNSDLEKIFEVHEQVEFKKGDFIIKEGQIANNYNQRIYSNFN